MLARTASILLACGPARVHATFFDKVTAAWQNCRGRVADAVTGGGWKVDLLDIYEANGRATPRRRNMQVYYLRFTPPAGSPEPVQTFSLTYRPRYFIGGEKTTLKELSLRLEKEHPGLQQIDEGDWVSCGNYVEHYEEWMDRPTSFRGFTARVLVRQGDMCTVSVWEPWVNFRERDEKPLTQMQTCGTEEEKIFLMTRPCDYFDTRLRSPFPKPLPQMARLGLIPDPNLASSIEGWLNHLMHRSKQSSFAQDYVKELRDLIVAANVFPTGSMGQRGVSDFQSQNHWERHINTRLTDKDRDEIVKMARETC